MAVRSRLCLQDVFLKSVYASFFRLLLFLFNFGHFQYLHCLENSKWLSNNVNWENYCFPRKYMSQCSSFTFCFGLFKINISLKSKMGYFSMCRQNIWTIGMNMSIKSLKAKGNSRRSLNFLRLIYSFISLLFWILFYTQQYYSL